LTRTFQILPGNRFQEREIALLGRDDSFPVPLIGMGGVILHEEVILASEQRVSTLWRRPNDLGVDRMLLAVIADVELDRCGAVTVEHDIDDQRDLNHHQPEFPAEIVSDIPPGMKNGFVRFLWRHKRVVILGEGSPHSG
jgi:hypothetical protein